MGSISHHQAKADEFLRRADEAITTHDPTGAAAALRRAAAHVITALAVHQGWKHNSRQRLEIVLHAAIVGETLSRSHLKTFRQVHTLPDHLSSRGARRRDSRHPAQGKPVEPRVAITLRRMRRRVASLITHIRCLISGDPRPVQHHKLWLRKPDFAVPPNFTCVQDILGLPNFNEITERFRLHRVGMDTDPDPHGFYQRGDTPRRCPCHPELWNKPGDPNRIILSPLWRHALEKTFRIKLPNPLQLTY